MRGSSLPVCVAVLLLCGTAGANPGAGADAAVGSGVAADGGAEDERAAIVETMQAWERAVEAQNYDDLARYYAVDAIYYPNGASPLYGRDAIVDRNRRRGSAGGVDITQHIDDVTINGDWALYSCLAEIRLTTPGDGVASPRYARVLLVMQKGADGRWRILRDIDNDPPDTPQ